MNKNKEPKVFFDEKNHVVITKQDGVAITLNQKEAKIVLLKLYSMFSDASTKRFFPEESETRND